MQLRGRGGQAHGQEEGAGEGSPRGQVRGGLGQEHRHERRDAELPGGAQERQLHAAQDPPQQGGPSRVPHDGGEGAGLIVVMRPKSCYLCLV